MKCTRCGAYIPDGELHCRECGFEIQIVPDYNPLEDVLTKEVKGSIDSYTRPIRVDGEDHYRAARAVGNTNEERRSGENGNMYRTSADMRRASGDMYRTSADMRRASGDYRTSTDMRRASGDMRRAGGESSRTNADRRRTSGDMYRTSTDMRRRTSEEKKRQQIARKKQIMKRKRQRRRQVIFVLLLLLIAIGAVGYQNSYMGIVRSGQKALNNMEYSKAESKFNRAIHKNERRPEAYTGLASIYIKQEDLVGAETVFLTAIEAQPANADLYEAAIQFYIDTKQMDKISALLDRCDEEEVFEQLKDYVSNAPEFSLDEGTYEEVQQVSLSSAGETIYYTLDGTDPTTSSKRYKEPILLNEGSNEVRAISVNKKGVPSLIVSRTYQIDIPVVDAPAVTPSTGQYDKDTQISIQVPDGYTAYYTLDGTDPTTASTLYTGPIDMPEGTTIFCAVLVNGQGKTTQITKRNYMLEYE